MYKYSRREHADLLLNLGIVRIGTLLDYQRADHPNGISDSAEGTKTLTHNAKDYPIRPSTIHDESPKLLRDLGIHAEPGARFCAAGDNVRTIRSASTPNCFIYCVSESPSKRVMAEFAGTDTCVEIYDMEEFLETLTEALNKVCPVEFIDFKSVDYVKRDEVWTPTYQDIPPAWIKEPTFKRQNEWRAIWDPVLKGPIEPIITGHHRLTSCVREIRL